MNVSSVISFTAQALVNGSHMMVLPPKDPTVLTTRSKMLVQERSSPTTQVKAQDKSGEVYVTAPVPWFVFTVVLSDWQRKIGRYVAKAGSVGLSWRLMKRKEKSPGSNFICTKPVPCKRSVMAGVVISQKPA